MSSIEPARTATVGEAAAKQRTRILQVTDLIGETAMAKQQANRRRSGEAAMARPCNRWRNSGEAAEAKQRSSAILRMGGAASPACAAARPPVVSKGSERPEGRGHAVGYDVRFGSQSSSGDTRSRKVRSVSLTAIPQSLVLFVLATGGPA